MTFWELWGEGWRFLHVGGIRIVWPEQTVANCFLESDHSNISGATCSLRTLPLHMKVNEPLVKKRVAKVMLCGFWGLVIKGCMTFPWLSRLSSFTFSFSSPSSPWDTDRFMWVLAEGFSQELLLSIVIGNWHRPSEDTSTSLNLPAEAPRHYGTEKADSALSSLVLKETMSIINDCSMTLISVLICYTAIITENPTLRSLVGKIGTYKHWKETAKISKRQTKGVEYLSEGMVNCINTTEKSDKEN